MSLFDLECVLFSLKRLDPLATGALRFQGYKSCDAETNSTNYGSCVSKNKTLQCARSRDSVAHSHSCSTSTKEVFWGQVLIMAVRWFNMI